MFDIKDDIQLFSFPFHQFPHPNSDGVSVSEAGVRPQWQMFQEKDRKRQACSVTYMQSATTPV